MRTITKQYRTLTQAERYQNRLYNQFDHVQLTAWPIFSEEGRYTWQVSTPIVASHLRTMATTTVNPLPKTS